MILHEPYGIDDPYKNSACERSPRDPKPGEHVQVRFRTESVAENAWAEVLSAGNRRRVAAQPLGDRYWTVDLGSFEPGVVEYQLTAGPGGDTPSQGEASSYRFEVGRWVEVTGVAAIEALPDSLELTLQTNAPAVTSGSASSTSGADAPALRLSFPLAGTVRGELSSGMNGSSGRLPESAKTPNQHLPYVHERRGDILSVTAEGVIVELNLTSLELTSRAPDQAEPTFRGSIRFDWLSTASGQVSQVRTRFATDEREWLYGLGERFTQANRNGEEWDVRVYEEYKEQGKRTYLPIPFVVSNRGYGLWIDADEPSYFDLRERTAVVSVDKFVESLDVGAQPQSEAVGVELAAQSQPLLSFCVFVGSEPYEITAAFTRLTGEIAVPPKWAFGPWMSSNSWNSQATAEAAIKRSVAEDVPAGVIVIEAWSDEATFYIFNDAEYQPRPGGEAPRLADFTFTGRWPDPQAFIDYCHEHGTKVVLWQIPVLKKLTEPHPQHDLNEQHMIDEGYGVRNADGTPYRTKGWWFTDGLVMDFTNPEARDWWFDKRRYLFDELGIDGMKTDGGEHLWGRDLRAHDGRRGLELFNTYPNLYAGAYHDFVQEATGNDGVIFSRAGFTGAQRFPGHWAGDENSSWDAYRASIRAGLAAGVSGVSMWSWDLAGFSGEIPTVELYLRSTAMAVFSPLMQYHSEGHGAAEVRDRTPWNIAERQGDPSALTGYRRFAQLRMRLLDLIYEDAVALSSLGLPLMRYPALEYPEQHDFLSQDPYAYLLGRDLLVAPVIDKGVGAREVRLPAGMWVDVWSGMQVEGSRLFQANATIERIPVFVRPDSPRLQRWLDACAGDRAGVGGGREDVGQDNSNGGSN